MDNGVSITRNHKTPLTNFRLFSTLFFDFLLLLCLTLVFLCFLLFFRRISWLWDVVDVVLPSVYLNTRITSVQRVQFVRGRMREAYRVAQRARVTNKPPVLGYIRYVYPNNVTTYLTDVSDLLQNILLPFFFRFLVFNITFLLLFLFGFYTSHMIDAINQLLTLCAVFLLYVQYRRI